MSDISRDHFAFELAAALAFAASVCAGPKVGEALILSALLLAAAQIDIYTLRIPDGLNACLAASGVAFCLHDGDSVAPRLLSAMLCCLVLGACAAFYQHRRGKIGLGRGDIKMFAAVSLWFPAEIAPWTIFTAAALALAFTFSSRRSTESALPFAPFIGLSTYVLWLSTTVGLNGTPL